MSDVEGRQYNLRDAGMVRHTHQNQARASCVTVLDILVKGRANESRNHNQPRGLRKRMRREFSERGRFGRVWLIRKWQ